MNKCWGLIAVLLLAGCAVEEQEIDDAIATMQAQIMDGTQVSVDRSSVKVHHPGDRRRVLCGSAMLNNPSTRPEFAIHNKKERFIIHVHDSGAVMFSFDGRDDPEGKAEFQNQWNNRCGT
jgi:hypothetical protein